MAHGDELITSPVVQQSFFGASITNFSINIGFNSNSSSLNLSLVEDNQFKEGKIPNINKLTKMLKLTNVFFRFGISVSSIPRPQK